MDDEGGRSDVLNTGDQGRSQEFATGGQERGLSPSRVQGQSPGGGLGAKPEKNANFQLRRGDMHPCPPLATPLYRQLHGAHTACAKANAKVKEMLRSVHNC